MLLTLTFLFAFVQLFGWLFKPNYSVSTKVVYLPNDQDIIYEIGPADFLPTYVVFTNHTNGSSDDFEYFWQPTD